MTKLADGTINLYGFARETLYIFNTLLERDAKETTQIITFFEFSLHSRFILYDKDDGVMSIYEHYYKDDTFYFHKIVTYKVSNHKEI